jgi:hypothetical protein
MEMDQTEAQEIQDIAWNYFLEETKSAAKAQEMMDKLAGMVQEPSTKLVHIGQNLFLIQVRGKGMVEFHTMGTEQNPKQFAANIMELSKYLRNIGVKMMFSYAEDNKFRVINRLMGNAFKELDTPVDDKALTTYVMEL